MTNMAEVITEAVNAVGGKEADWRVQAGVAALVIAAGTVSLMWDKIVGRKKKETK